MKTIKSFWIALLLLLVSTTVSAQCTFRNTAFKSVSSLLTICIITGSLFG